MSPGAVDEKGTFTVVGGTVYVDQAHAEGPGPIR
jgi:hypothetical protein